MTINDKIDLFFFPPKQSHEEYAEKYRQVNPDRYGKEKRVRYSPLYLLMRDIRHCFALGADFMDHRDNQAVFAGVVLLRLAVTNTAKVAYYHRDVKRFAEEFMGIHDEEKLTALNELRNALEHSYYSLSTYRDEKNPEGKIEKVKYYFNLGFFDELITRNELWKPDYPSKMYNVNPRKLYTKFCSGLVDFEEALRDKSNNKLRDHFEKEFSLDNWIFF